MEHVVTVMDGGLNTLENLEPCCRSCNSMRSFMTPYEMKFYGKHRNFFQRYKHRSGNRTKNWNRIFEELTYINDHCDLRDSDLNHELCGEECDKKKRAEVVEDFIAAHDFFRQ